MNWPNALMILAVTSGLPEAGFGQLATIPDCQPQHIFPGKAKNTPVAIQNLVAAEATKAKFERKLHQIVPPPSGPANQSVNQTQDHPVPQ